MLTSPMSLPPQRQGPLPSRPPPPGPGGRRSRSAQPLGPLRGLDDSIASFGTFDVIVAGMAIHHLRNQRKMDLYSEVARQLRPSGLFANLEVVASSTPELHAEFLALIGREADDPEDQLVDIESQLGWMRNAGLTQVDCLWRWRGFALLAGKAPASNADGTQFIDSLPSSARTQ
jgi:SAM-dependent methyltransferase